MSIEQLGSQSAIKAITKNLDSSRAKLNRPEGFIKIAVKQANGSVVPIIIDPSSGMGVSNGKQVPIQDIPGLADALGLKSVPNDLAKLMSLIGLDFANGIQDITVEMNTDGRVSSVCVYDGAGQPVSGFLNNLAKQLLFALQADNYLQSGSFHIFLDTAAKSDQLSVQNKLALLDFVEVKEKKATGFVSKDLNSPRNSFAKALIKSIYRSILSMAAETRSEFIKAWIEDIEKDRQDFIARLKEQDKKYEKLLAEKKVMLKKALAKALLSGSVDDIKGILSSIGGQGIEGLTSGETIVMAMVLANAKFKQNEKLMIAEKMGKATSKLTNVEKTQNHATLAKIMANSLGLLI